jgi:lysophospholipase L1-like esterase
MTVVYFGASVTVQRSGYRPRLHALVAPEERAVTAGIGSVGAISGLFLLDDLVLRHRPELCFVEFATTDMDGRTPLAVLRSVLEAIVDRLRGNRCEPCFLLLGRRRVPAAVRAGVRSAYLDVARCHAVRCIDVAEELEAGQAMLADEVHTTDAGAALIAERVAEDFATHGRPTLAARRPPVHPPSFQTTRVVPAQAEQLDRPAEAITGMLRLTYPYVAASPGNGFTVRTRGELIGLLLAIGPTSGAVRIRGGGIDDEVVIWDRWCTYDRLSTCILERTPVVGAVVQIDAVPLRADALTGPPSAPAPGVAQELRLIGCLERIT